MDTSTILTVLGIIVGIMIPVIGWLFKTTIGLKADVQSESQKNQAQHDSFDDACETCRHNFECRMANADKESDRRFTAIEKWMESINTKIDKLLSEGHK